MVNKQLFPRKLANAIKPHMKSGEAIVIQGARRTGKSTLLRMLKNSLPEDNTCFLDLEDSRLLSICRQGPGGIRDFLRQQGIPGGQNRTYLFLDEIQNLPRPHVFLKEIHDHHPDIKAVVSCTGNAVRDWEPGGTDKAGPGTFQLRPLDFEEFLAFKKARINPGELHSRSQLVSNLIRLYREYTLYGGYPEVVLTDPVEQKEQLLQQIIDRSIIKDMRGREGIRHTEKFTSLMHCLCLQNGGLLNVTELASSSAITRPTVETYLSMLADAGIVCFLTPFAGTLRCELFKTPKIYFCDTGILHMLALKQLPREVSASAFATSVFSELTKTRGTGDIRYWRTQDKKEISFILQGRGGPVPLEVRTNAAQLKLTALRYFNRTYAPDLNLCVHLTGNPPRNNPGLRTCYPWDVMYQLKKR